MNCFAIHFIRIRIYKNHWKNISVAFTICFCRFHNFEERQLFIVPSLIQLPSLPAGKDSTFFILAEASHNLANKISVVFFSVHSWGFWNSATKLGYVFPFILVQSLTSLLPLFVACIWLTVERLFNHKLALFVILLTVVALTATAYITPFTRGLRAARRPPAECSVRISRSHIHLWWSAF